MEDRLAKVRAELERRVRFHAESSDPLASAYVSEDNVILSFIDSMQEEPTIPDIVDEHWWEMLGEEPMSEEQIKESLISKHEDKTCKEKGNSLTQEIVSEDLEEVAKYYIPSESYHMTIESEGEGSGENVYDYVQMIDMFKNGANWQKQNDEKAINENALLYNARLEGIEIGKAEMKQQMMKDAVDAKITLLDGISYVSKDVLSKFKPGDKVKVIVIKEE